MFQTNKALIRERLLRERDKLEIIVNRVGFVRKLTLKGASGSWSVKEVLALILAREQFIADRLEEVLHDEAYTPCETQAELDAFIEKFGYPDFESPLLETGNAYDWIIEKYRTIALDEMVIQDLEALDLILSMLEKIPEEKMIQFNFVDRVATQTSRFYRRHSTRIGEWLRSITVRQR